MATIRGTVVLLLLTAMAVIGLYLTQSYLLFHTLAEGFSIVIAFAVFTLAWNTRRLLENGFLLFIGLAYLHIGLVDFLHTISYAGMAVFPDHDAYIATQLWIGARYLEAAALLFAPLFSLRRYSSAGSRRPAFSWRGSQSRPSC